MSRVPTLSGILPCLSGVEDERKGLICTVMEIINFKSFTLFKL